MHFFVALANLSGEKDSELFLLFAPFLVYQPAYADKFVGLVQMLEPCCMDSVKLVKIHKPVVGYHLITPFQVSFPYTSAFAYVAQKTISGSETK